MRMKLKITKLSDNQEAFTIIELMIATAVLSTILLLSTVMMVSIGKLYYKGINQSRVQDATRNILDNVSQHLQLSDSDPVPAVSSDGKVKAWCVGGSRYTYVINRQIGNDSTKNQSPHVLWRDDNPNPGSCFPPDPNFLNNPTNGLNGIEMIPPHSRLTAFDITAPSPYKISVGVAYGDDDVLTGSGPETRCAGGIGQEFCATAAIKNAVVVKRLTGD